MELQGKLGHSLAQRPRALQPQYDDERRESNLGCHLQSVAHNLVRDSSDKHVRAEDGRSPWVNLN